MSRLWQRLDAALKPHEVRAGHWIKGHAGPRRKRAWPINWAREGRGQWRGLKEKVGGITTAVITATRVGRMAARMTGSGGVIQYSRGRR